MIHLQKELICKVNEKCITDGTNPKNINTERYYPVIGYSVQLVERELTDRGGAALGKKKVEEIAGVYIIDELLRLRFVYTSNLSFFVDSTRGYNEETEKTGEQKTQPDNVPF